MFFQFGNSFIDDYFFILRLYFIIGLSSSGILKRPSRNVIILYKLLKQILLGASHTQSKRLQNRPVNSSGSADVNITIIRVL